MSYSEESIDSWDYNYSGDQVELSDCSSSCEPEPYRNQSAIDRSLTIDTEDSFDRPLDITENSPVVLTKEDEDNDPMKPLRDLIREVTESSLRPCQYGNLGLPYVSWKTKERFL